MSSDFIFQVLVVDDDPLIHQGIKLILPNHWRMFSAFKLEDIHWGRAYHAVFVDMHLQQDLNRPTGLEVIEKVNRFQPQAEVVAISGDITQSLMEAALKNGAHRFIAKPLITDEVLSQFEKTQALWQIRDHNLRRNTTAVQWVGNGIESQKIKRQLAHLKGENSPILIQGETGTGKEVIACLLNAQEGPRPFVAVNMASLPENLFESEMFGHVKGAFTGADQSKVGLIEASQGGDLFLDEVEAMPMTQQAKILRFLESGEIRKVGAKENQKINTRIIVASNQNLEDLIRKELFREDLYFRLSSHKIIIPPLRERSEDVETLANYFLALEKPRRNKTFTADALEILKYYNWPGNVRELKRICEQSALVSPLPLIRAEDLKPLLGAGTRSDLVTLEEGLGVLVDQFEKKLIVQALQRCKKDVEQTALLLKVSKSNLYKKIKDLDINMEV